MCGTEPGNLVVGKARVQVKIETPVFHYMFVVLESLALRQWLPLTFTLQHDCLC